jgi:hypothetical protein
VTLNLLKLRCSNVNFLYLHVLRVELEKCKMCDISWRHNLLVYPFIRNKNWEVYESWRIGSEIKGFPPPLHSSFAFYHFINLTLKQLLTHEPSCFSSVSHKHGVPRAVLCIVWLLTRTAATQRDEGGVIPQCAILSNQKINIRLKGNKGKEN